MGAEKNRKLLLASIIKPEATEIASVLYPNKNEIKFTNEIGLCNYRQSLIEVLDELELAGLNQSKVKLITGDDKCCYWVGDLNLCDCFDDRVFSGDGFVRDFFQQSFDRGKYLLLIRGTADDLAYACQIINSCPFSANIWYF